MIFIHRQMKPIQLNMNTASFPLPPFEQIWSKRGRWCSARTDIGMPVDNCSDIRAYIGYNACMPFGVEPLQLPAKFWLEKTPRGPSARRYRC